MGREEKRKKARYKSMPFRSSVKVSISGVSFPFSVSPETPKTQAMCLPNSGRLHTGGGNPVYKEL